MKSFPFIVSAATSALFTQGPALELLGYHTSVPAGWTTRAPSSSMRLAEFEIGAKDGTLGAEVVVYFFGKGQGGDVSANRTRWKAQFSEPDGSAVPETVTRDSAAKFPTTFVEYRGTYRRGVGPGAPPEQAKPNQTLIAAVVETPQGSLFIQMFGATPNVSAQRAAFTKFVRGLK